MFEYHYELSTKTQKENINLTKFEVPLQTTIQNFFSEEDLIELTVTTDGYILRLKNEFNNKEKRALGKKIAKINGLKENVNHYIYNKGKGKSGQLFKFKSFRQI